MMKAQRSSYKTKKTERLEARVNRQQKALLQRAADLSGRSLTDFILSASQQAANKVLREYEVITLTAQQSKKFVHALMNPPMPNLALQKAAKRHRNLLVN